VKYAVVIMLICLFKKIHKMQATEAIILLHVLDHCGVGTHNYKGIHLGVGENEVLRT
jgi:hypothetical protein